MIIISIGLRREAASNNLKGGFCFTYLTNYGLVVAVVEEAQTETGAEACVVVVTGDEDIELEVNVKADV